MSESVAPAPPFLRGLNGLRFFAALFVVVGHTHENLLLYGFGPPLHPLGLTPVGMSLFFVLSGFVIHLTYGQDFSGGVRLRNTAAFLGKRFARLAPLLLFGLVMNLSYWHEWGRFFGQPDFRAFVATYLLAMPSWMPYWLDGKLQINAFFGISWAIYTELFFYGAYPLLVPLILRLRRPGLVVAAALGLSAAALLLLHGLYAHGPALELAYREFAGPQVVIAGRDQANSVLRWAAYVAPYTRIFEFLLGALAAQLYLRLADRPPAPAETRRAAAVLYAALGLLLCLYVLLIAGRLPPFMHFLHMNFLFAGPIAAAVFCVARYRSAVALFLSSGPLVFLGKISYSLYINHSVTTHAFHWRGQAWEAYPSVPFGMAFLVILSIGTYRLIELPARRRLNAAFARLLDQPGGAAAMLSAIAAAIALGFWIALANFA